MFLRDIGIIPEDGSAVQPRRAGASITNLSRRGFVGGSGLFVLGLTLTGCDTYVEPEIDASQFNLGDGVASPPVTCVNGLAPGSPKLNWLASISGST